VSLISKLSQHNLAYMIGAEVLGTNIPRIALTRTPQERLDVFVDEATSSVGFFGGGLLLDQLAEKLFANAFKTGGDAARWARFGKTFGVGSALFGGLVAVSYLRNFVTATVNKTSTFSKIIQPKDHLDKAEEATLQQEKSKATAFGYFNLAAGLLAGAGAMALAKRNIAKGVKWDTLNHIKLNSLTRPLVNGFNQLLAKGDATSPLGKMLSSNKLRLADLLDKHMLFGGEAFLKDPSKRSFLNLTNPGAFAFWVLPTYSGYFTGSRSPLELMEAIIKFLNFTGSFFFMPSIIEGKVMPLLQKGLPALAKNKDFIEDARFIVKQGAGIGSIVGTTLAYQGISHLALKRENKKMTTPNPNTVKLPPTAADTQNVFAGFEVPPVFTKG
jgi:hypothetical protein